MQALKSLFWNKNGLVMGLALGALFASCYFAKAHAFDAQPVLDQLAAIHQSGMPDSSGDPMDADCACGDDESADLPLGYQVEIWDDAPSLLADVQCPEADAACYARGVDTVIRLLALDERLETAARFRIETVKYLERVRRFSSEPLVVSSAE